MSALRRRSRGALIKVSQPGLQGTGWSGALEISEVWMLPPQPISSYQQLTATSQDSCTAPLSWEEPALARDNPEPNISPALAGACAGRGVTRTAEGKDEAVRDGQPKPPERKFLSPPLLKICPLQPRVWEKQYDIGLEVLHRTSRGLSVALKRKLMEGHWWNEQVGTGSGTYKFLLKHQCFMCAFCKQQVMQT